MVVDPSKANYCRRIDGSFYSDSKTLVGGHPAVDLKSMETSSCWAILVGCIKISAHPVADLKLRGTS